MIELYHLFATKENARDYAQLAMTQRAPLWGLVSFPIFSLARDGVVTNMNTSNFLLIAAIPVREFTDRNFQEFYGSNNQPYFSPMYPIPSEWLKQAEQWLLARQRADPRIYSSYTLSDMGCLPNAFIKAIIEITQWKEENGITVPQKYGEFIYGEK